MNKVILQARDFFNIDALNNWLSDNNIDKKKVYKVTESIGFDEDSYWVNWTVWYWMEVK